MFEEAFPNTHIILQVIGIEGQVVLYGRPKLCYMVDPRGHIAPMTLMSDYVVGECSRKVAPFIVDVCGYGYVRAFCGFQFLPFFCVFMFFFVFFCA